MLSEENEKIWLEATSEASFHSYESGSYLTLRLHNDIPTMMQIPVARKAGDLVGCDAVFMGIPWEGWAQSEDGHSFSTCAPRKTSRNEHPTDGRTGAWAAPDYIRKCSPSYNWKGSGIFCPEVSDTFRVMDHIEIMDYGNVDLKDVWDPEVMVNLSYKKVSDIVKSGAVPLVFGGDHAIPYPVVKGISDNTEGNIGIIWFDGHYDIGYGGSLPRPYGHLGEPNAENALYNIVKTSNVKLENICIIGINGPCYNTSGMASLAKKLGITVFTAEDVKQQGIKNIVELAIEVSSKGTDRTYLTFDLDAIDPISFPAQKYMQPLGISIQESIQAIRTIAEKTNLAGMDMCCMGPHYDPGGVGGLYAVQMYVEALKGIAIRKMKKNST